MRSLIFIAAMFTATLSYSQFEMGLKFGLSSMDVIDDKIDITDGTTDYQLSVTEANYGFHFGLYSRISVANIYIEPAFLFNSSTVEYNLEEEIFDTGIISTLRSETYNNLDIPLMVGMKIGILRIQGGPVAHIFLNSTSELTAVSGYSQKFKEATYGIQGGIGLDILKVRLDINYETNLSSFGEHITVGGTEYEFDNRSGRLVASLGIRF